MNLAPRALAIASSIAASAVCLAACGGPARQLTADLDDYERYRRIRTAESLEDRLRASWEYLRREPDGRWSEDVRAWFYPAEAQYYADAGDTVPKLRRYLETLPDGPHARKAAEEIVEIESFRAARQRDRESLTRYATVIEEELAESARNRRTLLREFADWTRRLVAIDSWGRRTSALSPELIFAWRGSTPEARCRERRCVKAFSIRYAIPDGKRQSPRQALMDVVLGLDERGELARATITGPELFSRIGEAIQLSPVDPGNLQARAESIARAVDLAGRAIEPSLPAERCEREAIAPVVLHRECDGVRVRMTAAPTYEQEDRIEVRPIDGAAAEGDYETRVDGAMESGGQ